MVKKSCSSKKKAAAATGVSLNSNRSSRSVVGLKVDYTHHQLQQQEQQQHKQQHQRAVQFIDQIQGLNLFDHFDSSASGARAAPASTNISKKNKKQIYKKERSNKFIQAVDNIIMSASAAAAAEHHADDQARDKENATPSLNHELEMIKDSVISVNLEDDDDVDLLPDPDESKIMNLPSKTATPSSSLNSSTTISIGFKQLTSDKLNQRMIQRLIESDEHHRRQHLDESSEDHVSHHHYAAIQPVLAFGKSALTSISSKTPNIITKETDLIPSLSSNQVLFASSSHNRDWHPDHRLVAILLYERETCFQRAHAAHHHNHLSSSRSDKRKRH